jgi:ABC-type lipoprotein export system ATPase subunit
MVESTQKLDIEMSDVQVSLPHKEILFKIPSFRIPFGQHLLIQGESGKGKTSFLHLLAGLFLPTQGSVTIGKQNLNSLNDNERCDLRREKIGIIFQKLNLLDHLTAQENVALAAHSTTDVLSNDVLAEVNLKPKADVRSSNLSGGEQQRVAIARVLAQKPLIILADEPTSSLDEVNCDFVMQALKKASQGKTLIVVSHDHRIRKYFDQILAFEDMIR